MVMPPVPSRRNVKARKCDDWVSNEVFILNARVVPLCSPEDLPDLGEILER